MGKFYRPKTISFLYTNFLSGTAILPSFLDGVDIRITVYNI